VIYSRCTFEARDVVCCSVLQCVAVCCSVLQCVSIYSRCATLEARDVLIQNIHVSYIADSICDIPLRTPVMYPTYTYVYVYILIIYIYVHSIIYLHMYMSIHM